jgi:hypothetical protein
MRSINWTVSSTFSTVRFEFKRGALFSLDDAKNNHLVFVGSPSENLTLLDIPGTEELVFRRLDSDPRKGDLAVLDLAVQNVHPLAGEPKTFLATPANQPTTEDYAVVSLLAGLDPSLHPDSGGELHLWHTGRGRVCLPGGLCEGTATAAESCEGDRTDAVRGAASREHRTCSSGHDRPGLSP